MSKSRGKKERPALLRAGGELNDDEPAAKTTTVVGGDAEDLRLERAQRRRAAVPLFFVWN